MNYILITGASAGIGEVFARALAAEKQNLILAARREDRLIALASELSEQHGVSVEVLAADLAAADGAEQVAAAVASSGWKLGGLVNNAGFGDRGAFTELSLERQLNMIQVNVASLVSLTWKLLPNLQEQQGSFIINVASTAAFQAGPNMAIYYATKAFVLSFSEALHEELLDSGVAVSALCPGATASEFAAEANMTDTKLFKAGTMSAEDVVKRALTKRRSAIVIPGLRNRLMIWLGKISPRLINRRIAGWLQA
ncbi:SDR family oxidoreductase [Marinobacter sp. NP-4(2019)]|uniref:SDR family NAD(P)-dependent oxidoreductase n=1 Tax=Marinobacter sp. NP-4(2019) TaxID=2488665 RepID=UPI000FC3E8C8|nr:SDR family oxidoreductase [Marinobacter sp. NP-4(2019)]AZT84844.1 SDR family oxidoreductase [Marinobacter sp. NP-4(2019)]